MLNIYNEYIYNVSDVTKSITKNVTNKSLDIFQPVSIPPQDVNLHKKRFRAKLQLNIFKYHFNIN